MSALFRSRWRRRLLTVPLYMVLWTLLVASAPLWIPAVAILDRVQGRFGLRLLGVFVVFLSCELVGIAMATALWLEHCARRLFSDPGVERARYLEANYRLQANWVGWIFGAASRIFRLRVEIEGDAAIAAGPMLLFLRHTSMADTALAATLITIPYGINLRYVLKRELLVDPCLDIVGNRLPNAFAERGSDKPGEEIARVTALLHDLAPNEGVLIYPEGTRFTPAKRALRIQQLRDRGDLEGAARAESLRHVLMPRSGGPNALLEANPGLDLVVCAHTGLEAAADFAACWKGALMDRTIRLQFWRIPYGELPRGAVERERFVFECWQRVDDWVEAHQTA